MIKKRLGKYYGTNFKHWNDFIDFNQLYSQVIKFKFDWHSEPLSIETLITSNYKDFQNVGRLHFGAGLKNNRTFMDWLKENEGTTLKNVVEEFRKNHLKT